MAPRDLQKDIDKEAKAKTPQHDALAYEASDTHADGRSRRRPILSAHLPTESLSFGQIGALAFGSFESDELALPPLPNSLPYGIEQERENASASKRKRAVKAKKAKTSMTPVRTAREVDEVSIPASEELVNKRSKPSKLSVLRAEKRALQEKIDEAEASLTP